MRRSHPLSGSLSPAGLGGQGSARGVSVPLHPPSPALTPLLSPAPPEPAQGGQELGEATQEPVPVGADQDPPGFGQQAGEAVGAQGGW